MDARHFFSALFYLNLICVVAQPKSKALRLYDAGNAAFAKQDYRKADSLFTLSLKLEPHPDAYYNRAVCRRKLGDSKGYCIDMGGAATLGDAEAYRLFWKQCAKMDTILIPKGDGRADIANFRSAEFIATYKYNGNKEYEKYDETKELELAYFVTDQDTVYTGGSLVKPAVYDSKDSILVDFIWKTKFVDWVKTNHMTGKITLALRIDKTGKVKNVDLIRSIHNEFENTLVKELYGLPVASPASFRGKEVNYQKPVSVIFASNQVYVSITEIDKRKLQRELSPLTESNDLEADEKMPEFPGGPIEMFRHIQDKIQYPKIAKENGLEGKCYLKFTVSEKGDIINVDVTEGVPDCIECDIEAIKVIYSMPKWKPGMKGGKPVPVLFTLPINFDLR